MNLKFVGFRIKYLRSNKLNMSQEDFASCLGFDRTYMSRIEAGKQNITLETFFKICDGLRITPTEFFVIGKDIKEGNYE